MYPLKGQLIHLFAYWKWRASNWWRNIEIQKLRAAPRCIYETFKKTRKKCASDVVDNYSGTGVKQGCALQKHSYSGGATKMLLGILFARLDALIERTAIGSESVYLPLLAFQLSNQ